MSGCKAWAEGASAEFPCSETSECITTWCPVCTDGVSKRLADVERERGDPEGRQGWIDRPTPTLAEAFEHVQRLAREGDRETELALGIISEALKTGQTAAADRDDLAQRIEAIVSLRAQEAQEAVRSMAVYLRKAAEGLDAALKKGHALATEDAANWLEDGAWEALGGTERDMPPCLDGCDTDRPLLLLAKKLRAGEHLARDLAQDPAKEPV